jgi:hypothetical protein
MADFPAPIQDKLTGENGLLTLPWIQYFHGISGSVSATSAVGHPSALLYSSVNVSIADSTYTDMPWDSEVFDTVNVHSTSSATDRITIPSDGYYCFGARIHWATSAAGHRVVYITLNDPSPPTATAFMEQSVEIPAAHYNNRVNCRLSGIRHFDADDVLRVAVYQTTGGPLNVTCTAGPYQSNFWYFRFA